MSNSENNTAIYYLLESSGNLPVDFTMDKVIAFEHYDNFYIIFFLAQKRDFIAFTAHDFLQITDSLPNLLNEIMDYSVVDIHSSMIDVAIKYIENKMHSKNNSRFFFDAH